MYTFLVILVVIIAVLLSLIVLIQESKGGGLASSFSASNQIMGVRKTTDIIEKLTWGLAAALVILSVISVWSVPAGRSNESAMMDVAVEQQATSPANLPGFDASQTQPATEAPAEPAN